MGSGIISIIKFSFILFIKLDKIYKETIIFYWIKFSHNLVVEMNFWLLALEIKNIFHNNLYSLNTKKSRIINCLIKCSQIIIMIS